MKSSIRLFQQACRITLFTRPNCSLCTNAKDVLSTVWDKRPFTYKEIEVMKPDEKSWRDIYEFDTPVVGPVMKTYAVLSLISFRFMLVALKHGKSVLSWLRKPRSSCTGSLLSKSMKRWMQ